MVRWQWFFVAWSAAALLVGCGGTSEQGTEEARQAYRPKKIAADHLPNAYQIHPKVISGGLPEGDAAFAELGALGVKTVISVDGARPDVERARRFGLRYVHLPHGYDGIPQRRAQELAKAVRDLPGRIYIHCHHGKHRGPAAAAVACVGAGLLEPGRAESVLIAAGTSQHYRGLYESARRAQPLERRLLDELSADFPESAAAGPLAEAMVALEHTHGELAQIAAAGWKPSPGHPDLDPAHEALLLREHFAELVRLDVVRAKPADFQRLLTESESAAAELESVLREQPAADRAAAAFARIGRACTECHRRYRDRPQERM